MAITFKTTYDEDGNPQRVQIGSGTSFESGQTYSPNVDSSGQVQNIQTDSGGRAIADPQLSQSEAINLIEDLGSTPSWDQLRGIKDQLVNADILTTDQDEQRNMYQYLINEMLRSGQSEKGAQLIDEEWIPEGWRRTGSQTWTDPADPDLWRDIKGLNPLTGFQNPGVYNLNEVEGRGLASFPQFQEGWAKDELGITDWGEVVGNIFTPTPLKIYDAMRKAKERVMESDLYGDAADTLSNVGVGSIQTAVKPVQWLAEQVDKLNKKFTGKQ